MENTIRYSSTWQTLTAHIKERREDLLRKLLLAQSGDIRKEDQWRGRIKELDELVLRVEKDDI